MKSISTTLATLAPILAETVEDLKACKDDSLSILAELSTAATEALREYGRDNPAPKQGQDVPFPV